MVPPARHLLRAKDLADARYAEPLTVADLARVAGLSPAHFSREFRRTLRRVTAPLPPHPAAGARRRAPAQHRSTGHRHLLRGRSHQRRFVHHELRTHLRHEPRRVPRDVPAGPAPHPHPGLRGAGLRPPAEPHVSRSRAPARVRSVIGTHSTTRRTDDQDRQRPVLGARPGRGTRLLHADARLGGPLRRDDGGVELPLARRRSGRPGRRGVGAHARPAAADARRGEQRPARRPRHQGRRRHPVPRDRRLPGRLRRAVAPVASSSTTHRPPQPYGIDTSFRDPSGNNIRLTQVLEFSLDRR